MSSSSAGSGRAEAPPRTRSIAAWMAAALAIASAIGAAETVAQEADPSEAEAERADSPPADRDSPEVPGPERARPADPGARPTLPPPVLEGDEPVAPAEPQPAPEPEQPVILHRIGLGDHPEWDDDDAEAPRDVSFETPGDLRVPPNDNLGSNVAGARMVGVDQREAPRTFELGVAGGYARLLAAEAIDFVRIEERFEARLPEIEALRLGAGATQMFSGLGYLVGGGVRLGFGAFFCEAGWVQCEGVASIQPGVMGGDVLSVRFDLNASLDLRFVIEHLVELSIGGGYSLLGDVSLLHVTAQAALVF